jgi:hypothetical protein
MENDFSYLRDHYPQEVTSDQVRQMLHISKRKCAWMLQSGWIRCEDNGKKTKPNSRRGQFVPSFCIFRWLRL